MGDASLIQRSSLYGQIKSYSGDALGGFGLWIGYSSDGRRIWMGTSSSIGMSWGASRSYGYTYPGLPK